MKERMCSGNDIHYLLHEAANGNARCAYLVGCTFEEMGYRPFFVQAQFRRAANLGYPLAQRWLGILGLCHLLLAESSTFTDDAYEQDDATALSWLRKAASGNDKISVLILAKCKMLGIGTEADEISGEMETEGILPFLTEDDVLNVSLLFEYIRLKSENAAPGSFHFLRDTPLRALAG